MSHEEFASRYQYLSTNRRDRPTDAKEICCRIVKSYEKMKGEIHVGNSQMYATEHGIELAERWKLRIRHQAASVVQRWWREKLHRKKAATAIQIWWRTILQTRAANKVKRWWKRKCSTSKTLAKVGQIYRSVRIIQRAVRRWLKVQAVKRNSQISSSLLIQTVQVVPVECHGEEVQCSINWVENNNCAKSTQTPALISLQLSRTNIFYSDGIISIRRPPKVLNFQIDQFHT